MTKEVRKAILVNRIKVLENSPKNVKCPGVLKKLYRRLARGLY